MRKHLIAAAVVLCSVLPVMGQDLMGTDPTKPVDTGPWTVMGLGESCIAINRSPVEFNASPYNALAFHQFKKDKLPRLQAFFWPGALTEGADVTLQVTPAGQSTVELKAKAVTSFQVVTNDPAPADFLDTLNGVPNVQVSAAGVDQLLLFETATLAAVASKIGDCVRQ